eukprot:TRINITY_DN63_c0_g2_i2.p1 TRINITY_DN63_c0_g2~~TRINITY_DN63_c0_g2_i2.p1  ORF type:complete len:357 (+),score=75.44 TRINITY_DN63_c0_g2_i2:189-1259(+)
MTTLPMDIVSELPEELSLQVFGLVSTTGLCVCAAVSKNWKRISDDNALWQQACLKRWSGKQFRAEPLRRASADPWTCWKRVYQMAELDSRRTTISMEELTGMLWRLSYAWEGESVYVRFHPNYEMDNPTAEGPPMSWRWVGKNIRVDNFPTLVVRRLPDWGWEMRNCNAVLESVDDPNIVSRTLPTRKLTVHYPSRDSPVLRQQYIEELTVRIITHISLYPEQDIQELQDLQAAILQQENKELLYFAVVSSPDSDRSPSDAESDASHRSIDRDSNRASEGPSSDAESDNWPRSTDPMRCDSVRSPSDAEHWNIDAMHCDSVRSPAEAESDAWNRSTDAMHCEPHRSPSDPMQCDAS